MWFSINISDDPSHGAALLDLGDTHNKGSSQQSQVQIQMEQEQELRALQEREGQIRQLEVKEPWDIFALYFLNAGLLAVYFHIYLIKGCVYITFFPLLYHVPWSDLYSSCISPPPYITHTPYALHYSFIYIMFLSFLHSAPALLSPGLSSFLSHVCTSIDLLLFGYIFRHIFFLLPASRTLWTSTRSSRT